MTFRIILTLLIAGLLLKPIAAPLAAVTPGQQETPTSALPSAPSPPAKPEDWHVSPELWAQGIGALAGFGIYGLYVAPQAAAVGGVASILGGRLMAATLAGAGAVAGTFVYDFWTAQPMNYAYFWHRSGFIFGVAGGIALFGVLGYPADGGTTWLGWIANRVTLIGTGLFGSWVTDRWYRGE